MSSKYKKDISYQIKKSSRAKRMRVAVYCNAGVVVTVPKGVSESIVDKFVQDKVSWIESKLEFFSKFKDSKLAKLTDEDFQKNKDKALGTVTERVEYFNKQLGYKYNQINIKNQKTRWGSCSHKGNLNFNYKVIFLPQKLMDYVIVHELCHLKEFNHSKKFWRLVESVIPEYDSIRKKIKQEYLF